MHGVLHDFQCPSPTFHKRSQYFIRTHNETVAVVAMSVNNPSRSVF